MSTTQAQASTSSGAQGSSSSIITAVIVSGSVIFLLGLYLVCSKRRNRWQDFKNCITCKKKPQVIISAMSSKEYDDRILRFEEEIKNLKEQNNALFEERVKLSNFTTEVLNSNLASIKDSLTNNEITDTKDIVLKEIQMVKDKMSDLERNRICTVCFVRSRDIVFLDCGHLVCCEECSRNLRQCPFDKSYILSKKKIFVS
jgi:hypothetical protein